MKRTLHIGTINCYGRSANLFVKVELQNGKLSISGVEGPQSNGDAIGGCGQIEMHYAHRTPAHNDKRTTRPVTPDEITFAAGWDAEKWLDLLEIWHTWHLNDMRPNCDHQVGDEWDTRRELTLYHWRLSEAVNATRRATAERAKANGYRYNSTEEEFRLANLPTSATTPTNEPPSLDYVPDAPRYPGDTYNKTSEVKTAGWVKPEEHPGGLLCKPCPLCGHKYGSAWLRAELPADVVQFLEGLPVATKEPAWI